MTKLLIIKTGSTFADTARHHGDFEQLFARGLCLPPQAMEVHAAYDPAPLPDPLRYCGILITGAHSMITDGDPWIGRLVQWLRGAAALGTPVLGVCYGHQLIGQAFGGKAGRHPDGAEVGTVEINATQAASEDPLFQYLPQRFAAHVTHHQTILQCPDNAVILAANRHDPHQAIRIGSRIWGVQFHPEFSAAVTRDYVEQQRDILAEQGQDATALLEQVRDTPESNALLRRFAAICGCG